VVVAADQRENGQPGLQLSLQFLFMSYSPR
jgi:hypothetical protein